MIKLFTRPLVHCVERWCSFGGRIENRETHTSNYSFLLLQSSQRDARPVPTNRRVHTHTVCVCVCLTHTHTHTHTPCHCVQCCLKVPGTFGTGHRIGLRNAGPCADPRLTQITHMRTSLPRSSRPRSATMRQVLVQNSRVYFPTTSKNIRSTLFKVSSSRRETHLALRPRGAQLAAAEEPNA